MTSLTEELSKLFALHQAGALTAEEFKQAKMSIIKNSNLNEKTVSTEIDDKVSVNANLENELKCEQLQEEQRHTEEKQENEEKEEEENLHAPQKEEGCLLMEKEEEEEEEQKQEEEIVSMLDKDEELCELLSINSSYTAQTRREIEQCYPHIRVWELLTYNTFVDTMTFEIALRHLERIITNVLQNPQQDKYRRLRLKNERLQRELWSVHGTLALLESVGFVMDSVSNDKTKAVCEESKSIACNSSETEVHSVAAEHQGTEINNISEELYLRLTNKTYDVAKLSMAISAISFIRECDRAMRHRLQTIASLQTDPLVAIRLERAQELAHSATDVNSVISFFVNEFAHDDAHDLLCSSLQHLRWINKLLHYTSAEHTNIKMDEIEDNSNNSAHKSTTSTTQQLEEQRVVKLLLRNERVYQCIVQQRGALELLLHFAKCQLISLPCKDCYYNVQHYCESTNVIAPCETHIDQEHDEMFLVFPIIAHDTKTISSSLTPSSSSLSWPSEFDKNHSTNIKQTVYKETLTYVIDMVDKVIKEIECIRERRIKEERESAIQTMRERRQRTMLNDKHFVRRQRVANDYHQHHNSTTTTLPHERSIDISQQIVEEDSGESDDNNDNSNSNDGNVVSTEENKVQTKKRRVPVAEALAILLGKQRESLEGYVYEEAWHQN